jgi:NAD-dependent SIR2 family protein deacetylase
VQHDRSPDAEALIALARRGAVMVLSGAGLSTESGIPDYRGPTGRQRRASPMTYSEFVGSAPARRRYWARSFVGWRAIAEAHPNEGHRALARLGEAGWLSGTVTQNVDGLHQAAGSIEVIELHGSLAQVVCLGCGVRSARAELDRRLFEVNPGWVATAGALQADGDAVLDERAVASFVVVDCASCGGLLKPDVVFFGESVPKDRVARCFALLERSSALLVVGSSLSVMSGLRFVLHAAKHNTPVAIVNKGETRGDELATVRVDGPLGRVLPMLAAELVSAPAQRSSR